MVQKKCTCCVSRHGTEGCNRSAARTACSAEGSAGTCCDSSGAGGTLRLEGTRGSMRGSVRGDARGNAQRAARVGTRRTRAEGPRTPPPIACTCPQRARTGYRTTCASTGRRTLHTRKTTSLLPPCLPRKSLREPLRELPRCVEACSSRRGPIFFDSSLLHGA